MCVYIYIYEYIVISTQLRLSNCYFVSKTQTFFVNDCRIKASGSPSDVAQQYRSTVVTGTTMTARITMIASC